MFDDVPLCSSYRAHPNPPWVLASNVAFLGPQFGVSLLGWKIACFILSIGDPQYSMTTPHGSKDEFNIRHQIK